MVISNKSQAYTPEISSSSISSNNVVIKNACVQSLVGDSF